MRNCKKLLSIIAALTLFVSLVLPAGVVPAFAQTDDLIAYVNITNGDDATAEIGNESKPYATIAAAVTAIDAIETDGERIVQFVGASNAELPAHTNMITIRGVNTTDSTITIRDFGIHGPTKLENFKLTTGEAYISTNYHELILGENFETGYAHLMTGNRYSGVGSKMPAEKITVNSGKIYKLFLGSPNTGSADGNQCFGVEYVQNGGSIISVRIAAQGPTAFYGNVNVTLGVGLTATNDQVGVYLADNASTFRGNALQLIYNNGSKNANATKSGDEYPTVEKVAAMGGKFYELAVARNDAGSTLSTTDVAGTYMVNNGANYVAIAYDADGNEVARSNEQGYLTVPSEGVYTVGWELTGDVYAYVDATTGNDETAKVGNSALPYATMSAAISALDALTGDINRIVQINSTTCAFSTVKHTNMITVRGAAEDGSTTVTGNGSTNGPLTFTNVKKTPESCYIITNGSDIVFEKDATSNYFNLYSGSRWSGAASSATGLAQTNVIIKNGSFLATYLGNAETSASGYRNHGGVNYVFEGGSVIRVMIPGGGKNSFLGDVNITLNKTLIDWHGDRGVYLGTPDEAYPTKFNGNALQLIYNNGSKDASATNSGDQYPTVERVAAMGGVFYELVVQKNDFGLTLSTSETAGTYAVNCDAAVGTFRPVVYDTNGAVVEGATYDEQTKLLTVPAAGNYVVKVEDLNPVVSEIDFSTGSKWTFGFYTGAVATEETPYVMSFDYYLPAGSGDISFNNVGSHSTLFEGSVEFKPGHHKIVTKWKTVTNNNYFVPQVICEDTNTTLYIWNYSVTVGGANGNNNGNINKEWRNATFTSNKKLFDYDAWYPTMDDSIPMSLEITSNPTKTEYKFGETLDLDGLVLSVIDNYDVASVVTEGYEVSGFDSMSSGEKTITVSYNGMTATFTVTVKVPTVTEIDFSTGNAWTENIYKKAAMSVENPYVVTFEYFLPSNATVIFDSVAGSIGTQAGSSSSVLQIGHHTFKGIYAVTAGQNCIAPRLKCSDTSVKLYIWNYSITLGGEAITKDDSGAGFTTATVTAGNELPAYDWYEHMDSPITTEITFPENGTSKNSSWSPMPAWYFYSGSSADTPYVVSFDYYLPKTIGGIRMYCVSGSTTTVSGGTMSRYEGHHHAEWVVYSTLSSGQFVYAIEAPVGAEMYIWNFSVTVDGVEVAPTDKSSEWNGQTNGTTGTFITAYDWYETMDEVVPQYIAVATAPDKTEYEIGEQLITDGLTLEYVTNYSTTTITEGFEVSGFDSETAGEKTVIVTYGGLSASFKVTVLPDEEFVVTEDVNGEVKLTINKDVTVDFAEIEIVEKEGYIFNGWVDAEGNVITDPNLAAGMELTANYVSKEERFYMVGTQIREAKDDKEQALRFIAHVGKDFGVNITEKGTVVIPKTLLGDNELVIDGTYTYNDNTYMAQTVVGEKLWMDKDGFARYTVALTGITNYTTDYAVRGYIKYIDANGVERIEYTDNTSVESLYSVAEQLLERDPEDETANNIVNSVVG